MQIRNCCFYKLRTYLVFHYFARLGKTQKSLALLSFSSKIDRLRGMRNEMVKWINTSTSSVRVVKPSESSGLESPNSTHNVAVAVLIAVVVLVAIVEILCPRIAGIVLRRTTIGVEVTSKTANSKSVYIQLV